MPPARRRGFGLRWTILLTLTALMVGTILLVSLVVLHINHRNLEAQKLQESYAHLLAAFDRLSRLLRTTVVLTTLQGLSYKEVAVVLDTSEGTVAWRVHEARRRRDGRRELREHLPRGITGW